MEIVIADLVEVLRTPSLSEAKLAESTLRSLGLTPTLLDETTAATIGAGTLAIPRRVMVPEPQRDEALAALEVVRAMSEEERTDDPPACLACGAPWEPGFDVCWQCEAERP